MAEVSIRDLRNHGGSVVDRVAAGEEVTITRAGRPVARLHPIPAGRTNAEALLANWRRLPPLDAAAMRADLDATLDATL